jgi:bacterioferritin-associated ferredoxin
MNNNNEEQLICNCMSVSANDIAKAWREGAKTWEELQKITGVSTGCGGCEEKAKAYFESLANI